MSQNYASIDDQVQDITLDAPPDGFSQTGQFSESDLVQASTLKFKFRKWLIIIIGCFCYLIGYFHRYTPAVLAKMMHTDFGVEENELGIFSSMFFWSYGVLQPFIGCLADVIEPGYTIGFCSLLASVGSAICGLAKTLFVCSIGRLIVGIGCSAIYVSLNKVAANWYTPKEFRIFAGASIGVGGLGSILSQAPLEALGSAIGWRMAFFIVAAVGAVFGILSLLFIRGHPSKIGYAYHTPIPPKLSFKQIFKQIFDNLIAVFKIQEFWLISLVMFFGPGCYMDISGMWGVPYLSGVMGYSNSEASKIQMFLSFSVIVGSPLIPLICEWVHRRKLPILIFAIISLIDSFAFLFIREKLPFFVVGILFFIFGFGSTSSQGVLMGYFKEMGTSAIEGTLLGCGNAFAFIGGAVTQNLSSAFIGCYPHYSGEMMPKDAYIYGLWGLLTVSMIMTVFGMIFMREDIKPTK